MSVIARTVDGDEKRMSLEHRDRSISGMTKDPPKRSLDRAPSRFPMIALAGLPAQHDRADGREGVECNFYFCLCGIGGSADPDGEGDGGAAVVPGPSLEGNFAASLTMTAARSLLVLHAGSEMRHCASVYLHPQSQASALSWCNAAMRCSWVSFDVSIPGSMVARSACFRDTSPVSSKVSTLAGTGIFSRARTSISYKAGSKRPTCFCTILPSGLMTKSVGSAPMPPYAMRTGTEVIATG